MARQAKIGIIGLGYVGLPLAVEFCKTGFEVIGFDIDEGKIEILKRCKSYIKHIEDAKIAQILPRFRPTSNFSELSKCRLYNYLTPN
ncbi:MAG: NAD(P)-binding domain-containing protein [Candidatus Aenigmatarchaeota archaeon]